MGTTRTFYSIKRDQLIVDDIKSKISELADICMDSCTAYFSEHLRWIPIFSSTLCEGNCYAENFTLIEIEKLFGTPVIVLSVSDSDVGLVNICENGIVSRFSFSDESRLKDNGFGEYSTAFPEALCSYTTDKEKLQELWNSVNYIFAEDLISEISDLIGTMMVFDFDEEYTDTLLICSE